MGGEVAGVAGVMSGSPKPGSESAGVAVAAAEAKVERVSATRFQGGWR